MKLADVSIRRPVFATMMIMSLIVLGLFSYRMLNVDLYPDVDIPYVVITTVLPGAGPEQIETDVTKIIEDAVNPVEGVDFIQSTSQENVSIVVIAFKLEINGKDAAQDVREKISAIRANLPLEIEDPVIQRYDPASLPIMYLSVSGNMSDKDITTFTKDVVKQRLENIPGVGAVQLDDGEVESWSRVRRLEPRRLGEVVFGGSELTGGGSSGAGEIVVSWRFPAGGVHAGEGVGGGGVITLAHRSIGQCEAIVQGVRV